MSSCYLNILKKLYEINKFSKFKLDLENISKFSELQGSPHLATPFIHIAGTNGKGSVALKISKILQNSGLKTGLFTSPHLFTFRERIQIDSAYIEKKFIEDYFKAAFLLADSANIPLTYFEYVTMLCFSYFLHEKVDIAVLETGIGGRLDATNIVDPLLSIITTIGFDHCDILGYTLEEIATEKAGIIKKKKPCLIGPFCNPYDIFKKKAIENESKLIIVEPSSTPFDFNQENNNIAKASIAALKSFYPIYENVSEEAIVKGLKSQQICRNQHLSDEIITQLPFRKKPKYIILDVGHNPSALHKLLFNITMKYPLIKKNFIYGTSSKKDCHYSLEILTKYSSKIYLIQGKHQRCMPIQRLIEESDTIKNSIISFHSLFNDVIAGGNISKTLDKVLNNINNSKDEEMIIIGGSFFIMNEVMDYFNISYEQDSYEMNEIF